MSRNKWKLKLTERTLCSDGFVWLQRFALPGLVDGHDPEVIVRLLQKVEDTEFCCATVHFASLGPAASLGVTFLNDVASEGWSTVIFRWLPSQGDGRALDIDGLQRSFWLGRFLCEENLLFVVYMNSIFHSTVCTVYNNSMIQEYEKGYLDLTASPIPILIYLTKTLKHAPITFCFILN